MVFAKILTRHGVADPALEALRGAHPDAHLLVPDTNIFLECRSLASLPWHELCSREIVLILTRPVQKELDKHKNSHRAERVRELNRMLLELWHNPGKPLPVPDIPSGPSVSLACGPRPWGASPTPGLDPSHPDDMIAQWALWLRAKLGGREVTLLTGDVGLYATAVHFAIPRKFVEQHWLDPKSIEQTNENRKLRKENELLKKQSPFISVKIEYPEPTGVGVVAREVAVYQPLSQEDMERALANIKERMLSRIGGHRARKPEVPGHAGLPFANPESPRPSSAASAAVDRAVVEDYIGELRRYLSSLHLALSKVGRVIKLRFAVTNSGEKPANDASVVFEARGSLSLEQGGEVIAEPRHPKPPRPGPGPFIGSPPLRAVPPRRAAGDPGGVPTQFDKKRALVFLEGSRPQLIEGQYAVLPAKGQEVKGLVLVMLPEPEGGVPKPGGGRVLVTVRGDDFVEASASLAVKYSYFEGNIVRHLQDIEDRVLAEIDDQGA